MPLVRVQFGETPSSLAPHIPRRRIRSEPLTAPRQAAGGAGGRAASLLLDSGDDAELRAKALVSSKSADRPSDDVRPSGARAAPARSAECGHGRSAGNGLVPASRPVSVRLLVRRYARYNRADSRVRRCAPSRGATSACCRPCSGQRAQLAEPERMEAKSVGAYAQGREGFQGAEGLGDLRLNEP